MLEMPPGLAAVVAARLKTSTQAKAEIASILQPIETDLEAVTARIMEQLEHPVAKMVLYLITAGGKRLRPSLVLLSGFSGLRTQRRGALIDLAAAMELIHTATLIHDDIIDESATRRTQPTFHTRFGTERAVLMGDYLYSIAFTVLAGIKEPYLTSHVADVCQQLSRGELLEVESRYNLQLTEEEYLAIIRDKTASLIAACCHLGAWLSGAPSQVVEWMSEYGWNLGLAFQVTDDCLDLTGTPRMLGKAVQADLEKGALSLPILRLYQRIDRAQRAALFGPLTRRRIDRRAVAAIAKAAVASGAVEDARRTAASFAQQAVDAAEAVGNGAADALARLARYAVSRRT